ncbi:MAG: hypothetical protein ABS75_02360 [Pelagibacterium sp. SCN 63-23]|nr:MAG: hypothetical protein ABS75_02360 [Pelagibacterium sp. SCN 63-23]
MSGRIVILNGAPRSGKSTLARQIQAHLPGTWINWGVDAFNATLPAALLPGIGLRPGGERPDLELAVERLYHAFFATLADLARRDFDVVADLGLHRDYAGGLDPLAILERHLAGLELLQVGISCDIDIIMARRNADPQGGFYMSGPGIPSPVRRWQAAIHAGRNYGLVLDMGVLAPAAGLARIAAALTKNNSATRI